MKKILLGLVLALAAASAAAQTYPSKAIKRSPLLPEVLEKLQSYGYAAEGSTPERLLEINRDDLALWRRLVREAGIPLE